jgi:hypothetical protein
MVQTPEQNARLERAIKDNPDLPPDFVKDLLDGLDEMERGEVEPFELRTV